MKSGTICFSGADIKTHLEGRGAEDRKIRMINVRKSVDDGCCVGADGGPCGDRGRRTALGNATGDLVELDRIMKTQPISFLSGLIVAITAPVILNAASLSRNPSKIAKDNG